MNLSKYHRFFFSTLSGILLALSYPSYNLYYLQWFAFIPLLVSLNGQSIKSAYIFCVITGFWGICIGFYWVANWATIVLEIPFPLNYGVTIGHSMAVAQIFGIIFGVFQWLRKYFSDYDIFVFPITFVSIVSTFVLISFMVVLMGIIL